MGRGLDGYLISVYWHCAVLKAREGAGSLPVSGGYGEGETPLPIPNRAVKPLSADGTWPARAWESRTPPVFLGNGPPSGGPFAFAVTPRGTTQTERVSVSSSPHSPGDTTHQVAPDGPPGLPRDLASGKRQTEQRFDLAQELTGRVTGHRKPAGNFDREHAAAAGGDRRARQRHRSAPVEREQHASEFRRARRRQK